MKTPRTGVLFPLVFLGVLVMMSLFADYFAPYAPSEENRRQPYHPPVKIHWDFKSGSFLPRAFLYPTVMTFDENYRRVYQEDKSRPSRVHFGGPRLISVEAPAHFYLLGSDSRGRDLFSRLLYGARISLSIGILGAFLSAFLGFFVGGLSGYYGGKIDFVLMRLAEFFIMIPGFYFLLALRGALPPTLGSTQVYALTISILSLIGWGAVARVIRGLAQSLRQNDFIQAARLLGRSDLEILTGHFFPHMLPYLAVVMSVSIPSFILMESALSLLGLGIQEPQVSWGNLLSDTLSVAHLSLHPWVLFPGALLVLTALCFNRLGDGLREGGRSA